MNRCAVCGHTIPQDTGLCPACIDVNEKLYWQRIKWLVSNGKVGGPHDGAVTYPKYDNDQHRLTNA